jgi:hypothetical protein
MKPKEERDIQTILDDLNDEDAFIRKAAVEELRDLEESSEAIVSALQRTASTDTNKIVAAAARQALEAPAHQAVLEKHPELQPEEVQAEEERPVKPLKLKMTLLFGAILGVVSAGIFAVPISLVKLTLMWQGILRGFPYTGDNVWAYCSLNILGSAVFGLLAAWLGRSIKPKRRGNAWWGFLGGLVFDLLFVFIYFGQ